MKSKMLKRAFAIVLATAMTVSMAACGKNGDGANSNGNSNGEDVGPYTIIKGADGKPVDLGGIEVILMDWTEPSEDGTEANSGYREAQTAYREWAQKTYNFTFKVDPTVVYDTLYEDYQRYVTTGGDDTYRFYKLYTAEARISAEKSGLMYDFGSLDCINLDDGKWVASVTQANSMNNKVYGFRPTTGDDMLGGRGIYFNKRILTEAGVNPDDLYKWQKEGTWTWSKFEELCGKLEKDTNGDQKKDIFGFVCGVADLYNCAVFTNGGSWIGFDANGKYMNNLKSQETMDALNWATKMWNTYDPHDNFDNGRWYDAAGQFQSGNAAFYVGAQWRAGGFKSNMTDEFGWVAFPTGTSSKATYANPCVDACYAIPGCYDKDKAWKIAFALNVYWEFVPGYEDFVPWRAGLLDLYYDIDAVDSTEMILMGNSVAPLDEIVAGLGRDDVINKIVDDKQTPAQAVDAVQAVWKTALDEANK